MQTIDPEGDPRGLREAFGHFATGVTVVTVAAPEGPLGITVNSFTSVSLDPPLILWCPAVASLRHDALAGAGHFALHVLASDQASIARAFARAGDAFDQGDWQEGAHGLPLLSGCAARFICRTENRLPAGDHTLVLGRIETAEYGEATGLVFAKGSYGRFTSEA